MRARSVAISVAAGAAAAVAGIALAGTASADVSTYTITQDHETWHNSPEEARTLAARRATDEVHIACTNISSASWIGMQTISVVYSNERFFATKYWAKATVTGHCYN